MLRAAVETRRPPTTAVKGDDSFMTLLDSILAGRDTGLGVLAVFLCAFGSLVTARLFVRMRTHTPMFRWYWLSLAGVAAGTTTWCTHFVDVVAQRGSIQQNAAAAGLSFVVGVAGATIGMWLASRETKHAITILGGAVFGLSLVSIHLIWMFGTETRVIWDHWSDFGASVISITFATASIWCVRFMKSAAGIAASGFLLFIAISAMHLIGLSVDNVTLIDEVAFGYGNQLLAVTAVIAAGLVIIALILAAALASTQSAREADNRMHYLSTYDRLTELPNRSHLQDHLRAAANLARDLGTRLAVLVIDLDHFRDVNELRGHCAGDQALKIIAGRLVNAAGPTAFIARVGGDAFAVVMPIVDRKDAQTAASRIRDAICQSIAFDDGTETVLDASIGATIFPDDTETVPALLSNAELALYRAKASPRTSFCFYRQEMDESIRQHRKISNELRSALGDRQFEIQYQVQVSLDDNRAICYEALLRWRHPREGLLEACDFISVSEETGMILPIGEWLMHQACADAATWTNGCKVAVNLSSVQFAHTNLPALVERALKRSGLPPERLELEVTESTLVSNLERNIAILKELKGLGVSITLDDFGAGNSSLKNLRRFRFDKIKLDRSYIAEYETNPEARALIRAIIALGHSLDIPVLAEGVETEEQLAFLIFEGCNMVQGHLVGKPGEVKSGLVAA